LSAPNRFENGDCCNTYYAYHRQKRDWAHGQNYDAEEVSDRNGRAFDCTN